MDDTAIFQRSRLRFRESEWFAQVLAVNEMVEKCYKPRFVLPSSQYTEFSGLWWFLRAPV